MIAGLVGKILLREVPRHLATGVESGTLRVFGSIIRDASTGQIAGFLQEAAPLAQFIANPAFGIAGFAMDAGQLVQGEVIRRAVGAVAQVTTINLALSAAGIGISVAGFAILAHRLGRVEKKVEGLGERIDLVGTKVDQVRQDLIDADLATLKGLAKGLEEGWLLAGGGRAEGQWHDVAKAALSQQARFELRAEHILRDRRDFALAEPMLDAIAYANSLRVAALAACNESVAAHEAASDGARTVERLTGDIGAIDLVRSSLAEAKVEAGTSEWDERFSAEKASATASVLQMRLREAAVATRTAPLAALEAQGITPRDWLAAARAETEAPVLIMLPAGAG